MPRTTLRDVRLTGFGQRVPFAEAAAWVARARALDAENVPVAEAVGRVLAAPLAAPEDFPPFDRAAEDGYAVRSRETLGAGPYNPLLLDLREAAGETPRGSPHGGSAGLPAGCAALVSAGAPLPAGADAVLPFDAAQASGRALEVYAAVAEGAGVERASLHLQAGAPLLRGGRLLRPQDAALLASAGVERIAVVRRPRVRLVVAGPREPPPGSLPLPDADGLMLRALVLRDGGVAAAANELAGDAGDHGGALARAVAAAGADLVLAAGRTGTGPDDDAPLALAEAGELEIHGVALRPGGSVAMGRVGALPVILLPGDPLACLCAYELFAGELVRRLGGRAPGLPHATVRAEVGRKIVSAVGSTDLCRVRLDGGRVEAAGSAGAGGVASAARADGFVIVPAELEGYAPGAQVTVYLY